jgi:Cof subfamily protein (haloacid dehalogenase superfamily)
VVSSFDKIDLVNTPVRLLAIDLDGTLLNSEVQIPPANLEALRRAHEAGVEIVLVTGRRHSFALPIAHQAGVPLCLISSNGAVTKSLTGEMFHIDYLPAATARKLCHEMSNWRHNLVITFDRETRGALVLESRDSFHPSIANWMAKNEQYIQNTVPIDDCLTCDPIQAMFCGGVEPMRELQRQLAASSIAGEVTVLRTEYPHRDLSIVDVLNRTCSKGAALSRWATHRGIAQREVMAIGDNYNDLEMLQFAGRAFVMANASAEMKQNGWTCVPSNDENGVAVAIAQAIG